MAVLGLCVSGRPRCFRMRSLIPFLDQSYPSNDGADPDSSDIIVAPRASVLRPQENSSFYNIDLETALATRAYKIYISASMACLGCSPHVMLY